MVAAGAPAENGRGAVTLEQKMLAIWGGGAFIVIIAGWMIIGSRAEALEQSKATAAGLYQKYQSLYPAEGMPVPDAEQKLGRLADHQKKALAQAEQFLVPDLPKEYQIPDLGSASAQVRTELATLTQNAQRQKIELPTLPFQKGLSAEADKRSLELAQLYLMRKVLDAVMDVGIAKVTNVTEGRHTRDPSGNYAVITCEVDCVADYQASQQLLLHLLNCHEIGIGVRDVAIEQNKDGSQKVHVSASLLTANDPAWQLPAAAGPAAPAQASGGAGRVRR